MTRVKRSILALAVAGSLSIGVFGVVYAGSPDRPAAVKMDEPNRDQQYPHLHNALIHLKAAREELNQADPVFAGKRDDAIAETDKAISLVEDAWHAVGGKDIALAPAPVKLEEPRLHGHMRKALSELHEAYKELDDVEATFDRGKRHQAIDHVEKGIHIIRDALDDVEK